MTVFKAINLLNISDVNNLNEEVLKKAYRQKAHLHHPDKGGNPEDFIAIRKAYFLLNQKLADGFDFVNYQKETEEKNKNQTETKPEEQTENTAEKSYNYYYSAQNLKEYFEARIAELESKVLQEKANRQYDRARLSKYEQVFYEQIRLINQTKKQFEQAVEQWKNKQIYAEDKWMEDLEKQEILHNKKQIGTLSFLAKKDDLESKKLQSLKQADQDFVNNLINLFQFLFSTFYTLLDL